MFAIIKTGGKQYKIKENDTILVEKIKNKKGDKIDIKDVLLLSNDGNLHEYLTHPKNQIPKDYEAVIEGRIKSDQIKKSLRDSFISVEHLLLSFSEDNGEINKILLKAQRKWMH